MSSNLLKVISQEDLLKEIIWEMTSYKLNTYPKESFIKFMNFFKLFETLVYKNKRFKSILIDEISNHIEEEYSSYYSRTCKNGLNVDISLIIPKDLEVYNLFKPELFSKIDELMKNQ